MILHGLMQMEMDDVDRLWAGRFQLHEIVGQNDHATVYRATDHKPVRLGTYPDVVTGEAVFVVVLRPEVVPGPYPPEVIPASKEEQTVKLKVIKRELCAAMALVDPALAGFPDWRRIRREDVRIFACEYHSKMPWAACKVWTYRRMLRAIMSASRKPFEFTRDTKQALLLSARGRCERCGVTEQLEYDHIVPVSLGGTGTVANGQVLCATCHDLKTTAESACFGSATRSVLLVGTHHVDEIHSSLERGLLCSTPASDPPYYVWAWERALIRKRQRAPEEWHYRPYNRGPFVTFEEARTCFLAQLSERIATRDEEQVNTFRLRELFRWPRGFSAIMATWHKPPKTGWPGVEVLRTKRCGSHRYGTWFETVVRTSNEVVSALEAAVGEDVIAVAVAEAEDLHAVVPAKWPFTVDK